MASAYAYDRQDELVAWAEARIPDCQFRDDARAIGHERDGRLVAVAVYDTWSPANCFIHIASDGGRRWMTREFAIRSMAYPFLQAGLRRISCIISADNAPSLAYTRGFGGWQEEGRLRQAGAHGEDMLLFGMLREDCRWLQAGGRQRAKLEKT